jgi:crossover junction endodeoxyribonuclease RuvC
MIFLGIDIGYDRCGFAVLEYAKGSRNPSILSAGCITTSKEEDIFARLKSLSDDLVSIKNKYNPDYVSIEKLFFNRKNSTFEKVCMAKGVAGSIFSQCNICEVEPNTMKKYITGHGGANKKDIKIILEKILSMNLDKMYDDTIDALCLALYHCDSVKIQNMAK